MIKRQWRTRSARAVCEAGKSKSIDVAIQNIVKRARAAAATEYLERTLTSAPYDPIPLAYSLGAREIRSAPLQVDGHLLPGCDGFILEFDSAATRRRQRFTVAHEVGHLLLWSLTDRVSKILVRRTGRRSEIEELCNKIAAEILAPRDDVRSYWAAFRIDTQRDHAQFILKLSHKFDISIEFAALRYKSVCARKAGVALLDLLRGHFVWRHGVPHWESLRQLICNKYGCGIQKTGRGSYGNVGETYVIQRAFEWERLNENSLLVVVP